MTKETDEKYLRMAIELSQEGMEAGSGGPFGAVVVKDDKVVGRGFNRVTSTQDPTAHAEVVAIRDACNTLNSFQLEGCTLYTSCEPCPMCLGAIYWARPDRVVYACSQDDAASVGFDDSFIYKELQTEPEQRSIPMDQALQSEAFEVMQLWEKMEGKIPY